MSLLFLLWSTPVWAEAQETVSLSRYFTTKVCYSGGECVGPTAKNVGAANIQLKLAPFRKMDVQGKDAWEKNSVTEEGVTFKSEIHLIEYARPGKYKYYIYVMLRSGKREGVVKKFNMKSLDELKEVVLEDKPVKTSRGTIQAQLVLGLPLPMAL